MVTAQCVRDCDVHPQIPNQPPQRQRPCPLRLFSPYDGPDTGAGVAGTCLGCHSAAAGAAADTHISEPLAHNQRQLWLTSLALAWEAVRSTMCARPAWSLLLVTCYTTRRE